MCNTAVFQYGVVTLNTMLFHYIYVYLNKKKTWHGGNGGEAEWRVCGTGPSVSARDRAPRSI